MTFEVSFTPSSRRDLQEIHSFAADQSGVERAEAVVERILAVGAALARNPRRGHRPLELVGSQTGSIFEVHCLPFRLVYELDGRQVSVLLIADGRRDFAPLLRRRILGRERPKGARLPAQEK